MRAEQVILQTIHFVFQQHQIQLNPNHLCYALYPANKNGVKLWDKLEVNHGQKIGHAGYREYYMEYIRFSK